MGRMPQKLEFLQARKKDIINNNSNNPTATTRGGHATVNPLLIRSRCLRSRCRVLLPLLLATATAATTDGSNDNRGALAPSTASGPVAQSLAQSPSRPVNQSPSRPVDQSTSRPDRWFDMVTVKVHYDFWDPAKDHEHAAMKLNPHTDVKYNLKGEATDANHQLPNKPVVIQHVGDRKELVFRKMYYSPKKTDETKVPDSDFYFSQNNGTCVALDPRDEMPKVRGNDTEPTYYTHRAVLAGRMKDCGHRRAAMTFCYRIGTNPVVVDAGTDLMKDTCQTDATDSKFDSRMHLFHDNEYKESFAGIRALLKSKFPKPFYGKPKQKEPNEYRAKAVLDQQRLNKMNVSHFFKINNCIK